VASLLAALLAPSCGDGPDTGTGAPGAPARPPNIVLVLTDDQDAASWDAMPRLRDRLVDGGTVFPSFFATTALCCPSRTTLLRGQYAHNHRVASNVGGRGGYGRFLQLGHESSTVATWLQDAGYRTAFLGKYLNGYPDRDTVGRPKTHVPPGWSEWASPVEGGEYNQEDYTLNENGQLVRYGSAPADYLADVLSRKAVDFVRRAAQDGMPFFLFVSVYNPHGSYVRGEQVPPFPAPRHRGLFAGAAAPRSPSFDEDDVSDKPAWVATQPRLDPSQVADLDAWHRARLQSLQSVDELLAALLGSLDETGEAGRTYVFYTSDNGWMQGQHRIDGGKIVAYEESVRMGLAVRGPGVAAGRIVHRLAGMTDLAPTFADLAGAAAPPFVDGRSLRPFLAPGATPPSWRSSMLLEWLRPASDEDPEAGAAPGFRAVRTERLTFVEYATGEGELYDLLADPWQIDSRHGSVEPALLDALATAAVRLGDCSGAGCRAAENADPTR
jgi:arylsulfatase A-like enzyme